MDPEEVKTALDGLKTSVLGRIAGMETKLSTFDKALTEIEKKAGRPLPGKDDPTPEQIEYRKAFDRFDPKKIARYDAKKVRALLANEGIVRNRLKIAATIQNARAFLRLQEEFGSFDAYVWRVVGGGPRRNRWKNLKQLPARTEESDALSKDLRQRGFNFVGSTICYAFMQAVGMVNDHTTDCFRYKQLK